MHDLCARRCRWPRETNQFRFPTSCFLSFAGADPGFQVREAHLKKSRRAEGGPKIFGVFRVKNHDFTQKDNIFSNFRRGARRVRPSPESAPVLCDIFAINITFCFMQK